LNPEAGTKRSVENEEPRKRGARKGSHAILNAAAAPVSRPLARYPASAEVPEAIERDADTPCPSIRGTDRRYGAGGEEVATSSLHLIDGVPAMVSVHARGGFSGGSAASGCGVVEVAIGLVG
jgi:hypothetical protein